MTVLRIIKMTLDALLAGVDFNLIGLMGLILLNGVLTAKLVKTDMDTETKVIPVVVSVFLTIMAFAAEIAIPALVGTLIFISGYKLL